MILVSELVYITMTRVDYFSFTRGDDMARQYAPRAVLRHLPLELIRTFLTQEHILSGRTCAFHPTGPR